jgi:acetyl esterase/lipase
MSTSTQSGASDIAPHDIEYRTIGDIVLQGRWYQPPGKGPFPIVLDVHGGGWVGGDRLNNELISVYLARNGIGVFAIDFRMAPTHKFPVAVADVNYAIRWLRANAQRLGSQANLVCGLGTSSGGHLMLLNALQPDHPHHASRLSSPSEETANVACVVACWPVADPLARYRMVVQAGNKSLVEAHHAFWRDEAEMHDGSPQRVLEECPVGKIPPLLIIQGTADGNLDHATVSRFAAFYRSAGGACELHKFEKEGHAFVTRSPEAYNSLKALQLMRDFIHEKCSL